MLMKDIVNAENAHTICKNLWIDQHSFKPEIIIVRIKSNAQSWQKIIKI